MKAKLILELATVAGRIYERDPARYARLIVWIKKQESRHYSQQSITKCLEMAEKYLDAAPDWWAYLTKIMPKASARAYESQVEKYKREESEFINAILDYSKNRLVKTL